MKKVLLFAVVIACFVMSGCAVQTSKKSNIPETLYENVGYATKAYVKDDGTCVVTYACIGVKNGLINYVYLDQIENNPKEDKHLFSNKELQNAYGLGYESDKGEWHIQVKALESYIKNNNMTIDAVNAIEVYEKDKEHKKVPKINTGLGAVCELDISDFLDVINDAYSNLKKVDATKLGVGQYVRVSKENEKLEVQLAFVGTDYRYKICFIELETYVLETKTVGTVPKLVTTTNADGQNIQWQEQLDSFEEYAIGFNMREILNVETYDSGNGIDTMLPEKGTDLAKVCHVDVNEILGSIQNAGEHFQ